MIASVLVKLFLLSIVVLIGLYCFFAFMWRRKSAEDRRSYSEVMHTDTVKTCFSPEEYLRAQHEADREVNGSTPRS